MNREERKRSAVELRNQFLRLTEQLQPDVIFEIGANEATFSRAARVLVPSARMFAFEASPVNHARFVLSPELNGVDYLNMAVADYDGVIDFHMQRSRNGRVIEAHTGTNSILRRIGNVETKPHSVPCTTVKSWMANHNLVGDMVAWIDVEGASREVLIGMGDAIKNFVALHIEVEETRYWKDQWLCDDVAKYLAKFGFTQTARDQEFVQQHNVIFVREGG